MTKALFFAFAAAAVASTIPNTPAVHGIAVACSNTVMAVSNLVTGNVLATPAIGASPDSIAFDDRYAFTPNGQEGTITMVGETSPGQFEPIATFSMAPRPRIIAAITVQHRLCVTAAEYGPGPATGRVVYGRSNVGEAQT